MVHELDRIGAEHVTLPLASKNPMVMWRNVDRLKALIRAKGVRIGSCPLPRSSLERPRRRTLSGRAFHHHVPRHLQPWKRARAAHSSTPITP